MEKNGEKEIESLLTWNVEGVIEKDNLRRLLLSGKKLRVKHGVDPTGDKIHIGRAVVLWKLREFQDLGHKIVLIIGDFTAQIGDPSDKLAKRPFLTQEQIKKNLKNYLPQIGKILDLKKVEVRYNSEWLSRLNFKEISELADIFTVQQMIKRRNFAERWEKDEEISLREFLYPLMQGYDSMAIKADVEIGGTDQLFNLMAGRKIQEYYGQKAQGVMTTKMLLGTDGRKMSTSWGNVINIIDSPTDQYGKIMAIKDELIPEYLELTTRFGPDGVKKLLQQLNSGTNPKIIKKKIAFEVVKLYHGEKAAQKAEEYFTKVFSKKDLSGNLPILKLKAEISVADLVLASKVVSSKAQAWRLVKQGGFSLDEKVLKNPKEELLLKGGEVAKIGKKSFFRVAV